MKVVDETGGVSEESSFTLKVDGRGEGHVNDSTPFNINHVEANELDSLKEIWAA